MNTITGFAVFVIMLCGAYPVAAREKSRDSYTVSLSYQSGFVFGQAEEIVYPTPPPDYKADLLSQLLWDMKPVLYNGLSLDFSRTRPTEKWGFFSTFSLKFGIPGLSGKMEDRDWQSIENDALTNYSVHDNITKELFLSDISAGFSFPLNRFLLLKAYITMSYMRFRFSGQYGYAIYAREKGGWGTHIYASIDDKPDYTSLANYEKIINYTQDWLNTAPGLALRFYPEQNLFVELSFQISPLVSCVDLDEHLFPNDQYRDYMRGGLLLEPGIHLSYTAGNRLEFSLEFSWRHIDGTRGEIWRRPIGGGNYTPAGEAGAGLSIFDTGLGIKVHL